MKSTMLAVVACAAFMAAADGIESLAAYDVDPDGEILSQSVEVVSRTEGDMVFKTITVTRTVRKAVSKNVSGVSSARPGVGEPPVPPANEASEPIRIIRYFCNAWKDCDYWAMYGAMSEAYREKVSYESFEKRFKSDKGFNGGLADENINDEGTDVGAGKRFSVTLRFRNGKIKPRDTKAMTVKDPQGYRLDNSPIIPIDLTDL